MRFEVRTQVTGDTNSISNVMRSLPETITTFDGSTVTVNEIITADFKNLRIFGSINTDGTDIEFIKKEYLNPAIYTLFNKVGATSKVSDSVLTEGEYVTSRLSIFVPAPVQKVREEINKLSFPRNLIVEGVTLLECLSTRVTVIKYGEGSRVIVTQDVGLCEALTECEDSDYVGRVTSLLTDKFATYVNEIKNVFGEVDCVVSIGLE